MEMINIFLLLILMIIFVYVFMYIYGYYKKNNRIDKEYIYLMSNVINSNHKMKIPASNISASPYGNEYTFSFWIRIDDLSYKYGKLKYILQRKGLNIYLDAYEPTIIVNFELMQRKNKYNMIEAMTNNSPTDIVDSFKTLLTYICDFFEKLNDNVFAEEAALKYNTMFEDINMLIDNADFTNVGEYIQTKSSNNIDDVYMTLLNQLEASVLFDSTNAKVDMPRIIDELNEHIKSLGCELHISNTDTFKDLFRQIVKNFHDRFKTFIINFAKHLGETNNTVNINNSRCVIKNLRLQKWTNFILSVNNGIIDIYIDGELAKSCNINGYLKPVADDIIILDDGGYSGEFANLLYVNGAITQNEAYEIYKSGISPKNILSSLM